ncbi:protease complex subunit PrcB family protein [Thermohalobacter berrensis]|uniref:PrcB C-terminal domain-containing protein n=1 Tax=Thermohalobacter berrensis TaxID=99594 RepID=A0A419SXX8_9FIRM|nr:protease complex subunit PrcB family protein [Thermohalobacter berrensis]RKD30084.1 hypothetical protein BET03_05100 [Thermohalobacter berrensis]
MKRAWIIGIILVVVIVLGVIFIPKLLSNEGGSTVEFQELEKKEIPEKIKDLLPKYKAEERALACKVDESVYVIVTRGEKMTAGYSVTIDKIEKVDQENGYKLVVYAKYKDPKPDEIVAQVITYPTVVVKTNLEELPDKIELKSEYIN